MSWMDRDRWQYPKKKDRATGPEALTAEEQAVRDGYAELAKARERMQSCVDYRRYEPYVELTEDGERYDARFVMCSKHEVPCYMIRVLGELMNWYVPTSVCNLCPFVLSDPEDAKRIIEEGKR